MSTLDSAVGALSRRAAACEGKHTKQPSGYVAWHEWAEKKARTHDQLQCPKCGLWAIWKPRKQGCSPRCSPTEDVAK